MVQDLPTQMRSAMRRLTAGVCVITALDQQSAPVAMTASSVTSVSDAPPSVLVCVNQTARIDSAISSTKKFVVNVLGAEHEDISNNCANPDKSSTRFDVGDWAVDESSGLWYLTSAPAVVYCELVSKVAHGTHDIFVGNITKTALNDGEDPASVLAYLNGRYRHLPF